MRRSRRRVPPAAEATPSPAAVPRTWAPWVSWAAVLVAVGLTVALSIRNGEVGTQAPFTVIACLMILGHATVGALIATRTQGNPIGWLMIAIAATFVLSGLTSEYGLFALATPPDALPLGTSMAWISAWIAIPLVCLFVVLVVLFPTGHVASSRWRWLPPVVVAITSALTAAVILQPSPIQLGEHTFVANPTGVAALESPLDAIIPVLVGALIVTSLAAIASLAIRFRQAEGEER